MKASLFDSRKGFALSLGDYGVGASLNSIVRVNKALGVFTINFWAFNIHVCYRSMKVRREFENGVL